MRLAPAILALAAASGLLAQEATETPPAPAGQAPPPTFEAGVEQVVVDLVVTDKDGNAIPGITRDDLVVTEDGVPQTIVSFEAIDLSDQTFETPPPPPRVSSNTRAAKRRGRTFVVVFDDLNLTPYRARDAKAAVASFLESGVREGDSVTLIATSGSAWWTTRMEAGREKLIDTLKGLDGRRIPDTSPERLTDWEAMRIHAHHDPQTTARVMRRFEKFGVSMMSQRDTSNPLTGTVADPFVNSRAAEVYFQARNRNRITLQVLERVLNGLVSAQGRKSVILVSEGFIHDPSLDEFRRVNAASLRSNAAIYFVNARGLEGMPMEFSAAFGPAVPAQDVGYAFASMNLVDDGSEVLADESGGFTVKDSNDLSQGIQRIARETLVYYLLGYESTNTTRDGTYREIEVRLKDGKGRRVRARKGYWAPSADGTVAVETREGIDPVMQATLDAPWSVDQIPLRMTHYVGSETVLGKASVLLVAEVDIRGLQFAKMEDRLVGTIDFLMVVAERESGEFDKYQHTVRMRLRPSTYQRLARSWFPIPRSFDLGPGDHMAKIIVRESATGAVGSLTHEFDVPALDEFRVSTPIFSDTHSPGAEGVLQPQPVARREFPLGKQVLCSFEVFGAQRDETGMPRVLQGYEVRRADGAVVTGMAPSLIQPTSLGALTRLFGFRLEGVAVGAYEMVMTVEDQLSGKKLELTEPFEVIEPPPESPPPDTARPVPAGTLPAPSAP